MQHPSKRKQKKRPLRLAAVLAVLCLLALAAVLLYMRTRAPAPKLDIIPPVVQTLEARSAKELHSVTVHPAGADSYTLILQEGRLHLQMEDGWQPVSDAYADELLEVFTHIVSQETVTEDAAEVGEHLADMGLAPAKASAVIRYQDGSQATLEVGNDVPNTSYAYYRWSGNPGIYMCDVGVKEIFALTQNHLLPVEQTQIHPSLVEELRLVNEKGESVFRFSAGAQGRLVQPYAYPLSDAGTQQLLSALQNFRLGTREAALTEENRAFYGFDTPLCTVEIHQKQGLIHQTGPDGALVSSQVEAQNVRFSIGRAEGDYFYTCAYKGECYLVSRFLAETLVKADGATLLSRNPAAMGDSLIASIVIDAPKGRWAVDALRAERVLPNNAIELEANGQPVYDTLVLINGQESTQEVFSALCDRLSAMTVSGNVLDSFAPPADGKPRWSIAMETTSAEVRRIEAWRMDAFSDALMVDGVMRHYVHADAIDVLIAGLP